MNILIGNNMKKILPVEQVLDSACKALKKKFGMLILMAILYLVLSMIISAFQTASERGCSSTEGKVIVNIVAMLCSALLYLGTMKICLDVFDKGKGYLSDIISPCFLPKYFITFIIFYFFILMPLFLIPSKYHPTEYRQIMSILNITSWSILCILSLTILLGIILDKEKFIKSIWFKLIALYLAVIILQKISLEFNNLIGFSHFKHTTQAFLVIIPVLIPAIIFWTMFQFTTLFIIDKKVGPIKALELSFMLTKNVKWKLFLLNLLCLLFSFLGVMILFVGLLAAIPLVNMIIIAEYRYLLNQDTSKNIEDKGLLDIQ